MADRYWVGGTGTWNQTARWSTTSGGTGGASVPTAADNAYFDGNSDIGVTFTVNISTASECLSLIVGDGVTVTAVDQLLGIGINSSLTIYGSLFLPATNVTFTSSGPAATFVSTTAGNVITTNGKTLLNANFSGVGGVWTLGSALTVGGQSLNISSGTFNTNGFNVTTPRINVSGGVFNAGASVISIVQGSVIFATGTLNAGTSTISITNTTNNPTLLTGNGNTFYQVTVPESGAFGAGDLAVTGANTYFNFTVAPHTTITSCRIITFNSNQTITGTLSLKSGNTSFNDRILLISDIRGTVRTITAAAVSFGDGVGFADITAAGASAPWNLTGVSADNGGNNTNITNFPAPKTVYWNLAGSQIWTANAWATTSTGTPALANFPLLQDTAVITEAGAAGTIAFNTANTIGSITFDDGVSPRTSSVTLAHNTSPRQLRVFGDVKLSSGVVFTTTANGEPFRFTGSGTQNITSANRAFINAITVDKPAGTELVLQDNITIPNGQTFTLTRGTINLNNKVLYTGVFASDQSNIRSIAFGTSGKIDLTGNARTVMGMALAGNFTMTGTPSVELSYTGSTGVRRIEFSSRFDPAFSGGGATEANVLNYTITAGADRVITRNIGVQCACRDLTFTDNFTGIWGNAAAGSEEGLPPVTYGNLRLSPNMTFELTAAGSILFFSATTGTQQFTSSGKTFPRSITKNGAGTLRLVDNLTLSAGLAFNHTAGTVDINNKILTVPAYSTSNSNVRSLVFGTGELVLTGVSGVVWDASTSNLLTVIPGSGKIFITDGSAAGKTFSGGGVQTYPEVVIQGGASTATITLVGANRFEKITNGRTSAYIIVFPNETTTFNSWGLNGTEGNLLTFVRTGGSGGFTISYAPSGTMIAQFVSISNSTFLPVGKGYAVKSVNGGNNTGWIFGAPAFGKFLSFFSSD